MRDGGIPSLLAGACVCVVTAQPPSPPQMLEWGVKKLLEADHFTPSIDRGRGLGGGVERGGGDICYYKLLKRSRDTLEMRLWSRLGSGTRNVRVCMKIATRVNEWIYLALMILDVLIIVEMRFVQKQVGRRAGRRAQRATQAEDACDLWPMWWPVSGVKGCLGASPDEGGGPRHLYWSFFGANSRWCGQRANGQDWLSLSKQCLHCAHGALHDPQVVQGHRSRWILPVLHGIHQAPRIRSVALKLVRTIRRLDVLLRLSQTSNQVISTDVSIRLMYPWWHERLFENLMTIFFLELWNK